MIPQLRKQFNSNFTNEKYHELTKKLDEAVGTHVDFRICETPVFLPSHFVEDLQNISLELIQQLMSPTYLHDSMRAVPDRYKTLNDDEHPTFLAIDFAITKNKEGLVEPKLIELQGFPSLLGYQLVLPKIYQKVFDLPNLKYLLNGLSERDYIAIFRKAVVGDHNPENVILMEIEPEKQKTYPDFLCVQQIIGVKPICVTVIKKRGRKLYYNDNGKDIPIHRIFNRLIVDEFIKKNIQCEFDFRDDLEVEWAGHPNWFFRISKFSLPYLNHPVVPRAFFLHQLERYPEPLDQFVLKPLYSFAGSGVIVELSKDDLDAIAEPDRPNYLLQEKIEYAPIVETPNEPSKVEVRMLIVWTDELRVMTTLARFSKGKMMGVDYNKNKDWVGSSCCFF